MKDIKWVFVLYSIAAVLAMCSIGVSVALSSLFGIILSIVALIFIMGYGFKTKKKMRELGTL
ncbi:YlaF family protein [Sporosarcina ureilytica]|uniref:YlaF family protein n=1 Tax=Sporosarcina ureilytica TaxID=298596 RepID=A0A1D8JI55_9BACL|nr:YlaF family protein [Sporosarcina ureilytica]AOV08389.1 hypothetical protein BI350_13150 [Sporosarcina ureilytica]